MLYGMINHDDPSDTFSRSDRRFVLSLAALSSNTYYLTYDRAVRQPTIAA